MGRQVGQAALFYEFRLEERVPTDHLLRRVDAVLDLSWVRGHMAGHYSSTGWPSIDPELMVRMLLVGYLYGIRSERRLCEEVELNLAHRWLGPAGPRGAACPTTPPSRRTGTGASATAGSCVRCSSASSSAASRRGWRRPSTSRSTVALCGRMPIESAARRTQRSCLARMPRAPCASISPTWTARCPTPRASCARRPRRYRSPIPPPR